MKVRSRCSCPNARTNSTFEKLIECGTVEGVREQQAAFPTIADANAGNRAAGSPGYDASIDYVVATLTAVGWNVTLDGSHSFLPTPPRRSTLWLVRRSLATSRSRRLPGRKHRRGWRRRVVRLADQASRVSLAPAGPPSPDHDAGVEVEVETGRFKE